MNRQTIKIFVCDCCTNIQLCNKSFIYNLCAIKLDLAKLKLCFLWICISKYIPNLGFLYEFENMGTKLFKAKGN